MTKIKLCGLSRTQDIEFVNEALPDYIGFVFANSKRQISFEQAKQLKSQLKEGILVVGVFVNEDIDNVILLCKLNIIDIIQLHGDEDQDYVNRLRKKLKNPIIKAARIKHRDDILDAECFESDYLLLDAYKEGQYGGSGEVFDWTVISDIKRPFFLAGGIDTTNVIDAITKVRPFAIDISSGVETDGVKDKNKILDIITKVRSVYPCQKADLASMEDNIYRKH